MGDSRWQDIRYAVRTLRRARGASLLIVATLAVVIAATTSILTVANRLLLRPAPRDRDPEGARSGARDPRVALWPQSGPSTFGGVVALMLAVTCAASYLPARRAASLDPVQALRSE